MAIPVNVGYTTAFGTTSATPTFDTPQAGSAPVAGDIILMFVETANQVATITNANGGTWTEIPTHSPQGVGTAGATGATRLTMWWSRWTGGQGNPTVGVTSGNHTEVGSGWWSGCVASGSPINASNGGTDATGPTTLTIGGVTTTVADCLVIYLTADDWDNALNTRYTNWTNANLSSITEIADYGTTTGNGGGLGGISGGKATAGATGNTTVDQNAAITVNAWITVALAPAGATNYNETGKAVNITATVTPTDQVDHKELARPVDVIATVTATDTLTGSSPVNQEGFRWRNDDGDEDGATWKAAQDTNTTLDIGTPARLRVLLDTNASVSGKPYTLYFKKSTDSTWAPVSVEAMGVEHVWTGATPTAATDSSAYNLGTYFSMVSAKTLVGIRIWNPGLVTPQGGQNRTAYLWTATNTSGAGGVIQRTIDLPDLMTAGWSEHLFATTYPATTGVIYCVAYFVDGGTTAGTADYGAVAGGLTGTVSDGTVNLDVGRYVVSSTPGVIPSSASTAFYGVDVLYGSGTGVPTGPVYIATSANIAAGGEVTTAQLTPPTGKTTSDFSVGRMWDDENGIDSVDI